MQIREARIGDGKAIATLLAALDYPTTEGFIESKIEQQLKHHDARLLVAIEGGEILGFVSLHFIPQLALPGDFCRISYFCVGEASRSRGVGARLEEAAVALARERSCDRIRLTAMRDERVLTGSTSGRATPSLRNTC
ncbi:GNAT family N-acetyltransferase [Dechloromonas sp. A34]|uniref:GNAT family N-acetyltransferase n=1 Tax=Dechloromonas sp. A34 TaxID=447588 RepID=UPI00224965BF|nr:GNAT family N-acetyltransferase [Dechloromonas sp. A34]